MSFDQLSFDDKTGVNADSFSAQSALQHMSRRCIMALSANASRVVGLASSGLFCTASACTSILNDAVAVEDSISLDWLITLTLLPSPLEPFKVGFLETRS